MITPNFLNSRDTVAIVSTARKVCKEELNPAINLLKDWGLNVIFGKTIGEEENQFAGGDALRTSDFQEMLDNSNIKAIWCARGGYGTIRIIDRLDFSAFKKNPKWIIGYSDITVLHSYIHNLGFETLHAQMPYEIEKKTEATKTSLKNVLFGDNYVVSYSTKETNLRQGQSKGRLIGGNLSMLYSQCGSPTAIDTEGKILFIEDLDEYLYHIDRMLQNLKRNGMFDEINGLIVGGMTQINDNAIPYGKTPEEIISDICEEYDFPIAYNFPAGHVIDNRTLILGREVVLNVLNKDVSLEF